MEKKYNNDRLAPRKTNIKQPSSDIYLNFHNNHSHGILSPPRQHNWQKCKILEALFITSKKPRAKKKLLAHPIHLYPMGVTQHLKCYCDENFVFSFPVFLSVISYLDPKFHELAKFFAI